MDKTDFIKAHRDVIEKMLQCNFGISDIRNEFIKMEFEELVLNSEKTRTELILDLANKYNLSFHRVKSIVYE